MVISIAIWGLLIGAIISLLYAFIQTKWINKQDQGTDELKRISSFVSNGAMTFIKREYKVLTPFVIIVAGALFFINQGIDKFQALAFLFGALASGGAGFIGMKVATAANSRTTAAATKGINRALAVAFSGGSVMGMSVVGLALLGIFIVFTILKLVAGIDAEIFEQTFLPVITGFSLGASSIALFARVGGGIFTKAADVGADLVGKVEAGIPEDDPRNPATIADNVGDNVGDVAGMGADLFESFVGSIIGSLILSFSLPVSDDLKFKFAAIPLFIVVIGAIASIIGVFFVKVKDGQSPQKGLNRGTTVSAIIVLLAIIPLLQILFKNVPRDAVEVAITATQTIFLTPLRIYLAILTGLAAGIIIGYVTEFYTGFGTRPVKSIVKASATGSATNIITGLSVGMYSCLIPVLTICAAIGGSFLLGGLYGIALAALGMLVTLGIQLAVDAYGPIADNAGGLAVMSEYPAEIRDITDTLDAVGNTTAAIGKGFAIGSAALTSIILFSAFKELIDVDYIDLTSVTVIIGLFIGAVLPYIFSALAMDAVGRAAFKMIEEVRRQFRTISGILENKATPDYDECINISTKAALKEMIIPGLGAVITPVLVGFLGGVEMLSGVLIGVTASGIILAIFMANAGGAWDNAKKMIENGEEGGKGSEAHKASVVGDTVGDPFKDTAGPSINILIKLMAVIALVIAPLL